MAKPCPIATTEKLSLRARLDALRPVLQRGIIIFQPIFSKIPAPLKEECNLRRALSRSWIPVFLTILLLTGLSRPAWAHAILMESTPKLHATVTGPDVPILLRFNVRIDGSRSRLHLLAADGSLRTLALAKQSTPDKLQSQAIGLKPGTYKLRWQVLASDGHISSGEVAFSVKAAEG
jgi:methionine-rich copper-binding protein CopC